MFSRWPPRPPGSSRCSATAISHPAARSTSSVAATCSGTTGARVTVERVHAAATRSVPASIRSGMASCRHPRSDATPSTRISDVPAPAIFAPAATSIAHRSTTSGSAAAFATIVSPSASAAATTALSVAPTLGYRARKAPAPRSRGRFASPRSPPPRFLSPPPSPRLVALAITTPSGVTSTSAPRASNAARWRSTGRAPMAHPPGRGMRTLPRRPRMGPAAKKLARSFRTASGSGASEVSSEASTSTVPGPRASRCTTAPTERRTSIMERTSRR